MQRRSNTVAVVIVCTGLVLALFSGKAFHIDDPLFIWAARQIGANPLDFYGFNVNWFGVLEPATRCIKNPPLASYYAVLVMRIFGSNGIALHMAFIVPALLAMAGTYRLAKRWCSQPLVAVIVAAINPVFMVSATSIMCDMLMVCFFVWALEFWIRGMETGKQATLAMSALFMCLSAFSKYFGISCMLLVLVYTLMVKRRPGWWIAYPAGVGAVLWGYDAVTAKMYGHGLLTDAVSYSQNIAPLLSGSAGVKGAVTLLFTGGCFLSILFYIPLLRSRRLLYILLTAMVAGIGVLFIPGLWNRLAPLNPQSTPFTLFQAGILFAGAVACIGIPVFEVYKRRDVGSVVLLLWILGTLTFTGFFNWTVNGRSILPMAPALGIVFARMIKDNADNRVARLQWVALIPAALLTLFVMWADCSLANSSREAADQIARDYGKTGRTIWFEGHWGFQYYMQKNGCMPLELNRSDQVQSGDIIILPFNNSNVNRLPDSFAREIKSISLLPCSFLSVMNVQGHAGFYASVWGPLPYVFGPAPHEEYTINEVR